MQTPPGSCQAGFLCFSHGVGADSDLL